MGGGGEMEGELLETLIDGGADEHFGLFLSYKIKHKKQKRMRTESQHIPLTPNLVNPYQNGLLHPLLSFPLLSSSVWFAHITIGDRPTD